MDKRYLRLKAISFFAEKYHVDLWTAKQCHHETIEMMVEFFIKMKNKNDRSKL